MGCSLKLEGASTNLKTEYVVLFGDIKEVTDKVRSLHFLRVRAAPSEQLKLMTR